jgi:hypothetical protein
MIRCIALLHQKTNHQEHINQPRYGNLMPHCKDELTRLITPQAPWILMEMIEEKLEVNSRFFRVNLLQLENAAVAFFFEERMRMGTVAIAMPGTGEVAVGRSSVLVGARYMMTTRALAERLAAKTGKIALVSLFTELDETEALRVYAKLLDKVPAASQTRARSPIVDSI